MNGEKKTQEQITKEAMDKINKAKADRLSDEERKKAETKGAASDSSTGKPKTEEEKALVAQAEAQAKKDDELLSKDEKDLTAEEKTRKQEILDKKKAPKELDEDKVNKRKAEIQAEIDKLISEKKSLEDVKQQSENLKKDISDMHTEIENLKKEKAKIDANKNIPEEQKALKKKEEERLVKYLDEDKSLPREQRREMPKDELEEWLLEDNVSANEWMVERSLRRSRERFVDGNSQKRDKFIKDFLAKQEESNKRVLAKHPELDTSKREKELKEAGKSNEEIQTILCKEVPKYKLSAEIVKENPDQYLLKENGPELVAAELEKRLKGAPKKEENPSEVERLTAELEARDAEIARLKGLDETVDSTRLADKKRADEKKTEFQLKQEAIAKKAGISPERLKARIAARASAGVES